MESFQFRNFQYLLPFVFTMQVFKSANAFAMKKKTITIYEFVRQKLFLSSKKILVKSIPKSTPKTIPKQNFWEFKIFHAEKVLQKTRKWKNIGGTLFFHLHTFVIRFGIKKFHNLLHFHHLLVLVICNQII